MVSFKRPVWESFLEDPNALDSSNSPIPLPKGWPRRVRSAVLYVLSLARVAYASARGWAAYHASSRVRKKAELERCQQELALLREELRVKDARMARVPPHQRPHYSPTDRMAILQLRAARGGSLEQTAQVFLLTAATIAS
jgi:hypothetical protein